MITLFASPATLQYRKDVLSVLALPRGGNYQFRYVSKYIDPNALSLFRLNELINADAIIALKSTYDTSEKEKYCVPIRLAVIKTVERMADGYVINFEVKGYPSFSIDFKPNSFSELNNYFNKKISKFETQDITVWNESIPTVEMNDDIKDDNKNWGNICYYINMIPEFENYHLIRYSIPYVEKWDKELPRKQQLQHINKYYKITEGECFCFDIEYFSTRYHEENNKTIKILYDDKVISQTKGNQAKIQSRYGCIKFGFQPQKVPNKTISELVFFTQSHDANEVPIEVSVPVIICKKTSKIITQTILASLGAGLIALPAIVKDLLPIWVSIIFAVLGVIIIGITNFINSRE